MRYNNFVSVVNGQNKTGTMIINNTEINDDNKISDYGFRQKELKVK
jgi:hypothetical protein